MRDIFRSIGWMSIIASAIFCVCGVFFAEVMMRQFALSCGAAMFVIGDVILLIISSMEG